MPTPDQANPGHRGIDWPAVARTFLLQIFVLVALGVALVSYIEWSSDVAFEEFVAASKAAQPDTQLQPQSATAVHAVNGQVTCARKRQVAKVSGQ